MSKVILYCSFCGKDNNEVKFLIAGPHPAFICDECITLCNEIIIEETLYRDIRINGT